jgi:hypothetical protein
MLESRNKDYRQRILGMIDKSWMRQTDAIIHFTRVSDDSTKLSKAEHRLFRGQPRERQLSNNGHCSHGRLAHRWREHPRLWEIGRDSLGVSVGLQWLSSRFGKGTLCLLCAWKITAAFIWRILSIFEKLSPGAESGRSPNLAISSMQSNN